MPQNSFLPRLAGAAAALLGGVALLGWAAKLELLAKLLPGIGGVAPNTALCFLLAGAWLMLAGSPRRQKWQIASSGAVILLAGVALFQYLLGIQPASSQLQLFLNTTPAPVAGSFTGRMAANTALAFLLWGLATAILRQARTGFGVILAALLVAGVIFLPSSNLTGGIVGIELFFMQSQQALMSPFTAVGLLILSAGLGALIYQRGLNQRVAAGEDSKIVLLAAGALVLTTLFSGLLVFGVVVRHTERELQEGLMRSLHDRTEVFRREIEENMNNAVSIAGHRPLFIRKLALVSAGSAGPADLQDINRVVDSIASSGSLRALKLYDAGGRKISERGNFVANPAVTAKLATVPGTRLIWREEYFLDVVLPITEKGRRVGKIAMEFALPAVTSLSRNYAGLGASGEMRVCAALGEGEMRCLPSRHRPQPATISRFAGGAPLPADLALQGRPGVAKAVDYRGRNVIAAYAPVLGLGMVLKKDEDEFFQPIRQQLLKALPILFAMILLGVGLIYWRVMPLARELVNARNRTRAILDNAAEGVVVFDGEGVVESVNPAATKIFGYAPSEIIGRSIQLLLPDECSEAGGKCRLAAGFEPERTGSRETRGRRRDGAYFPLELTFSRAVLNRQRFIVAIVRDIGERKRAEERLRESEARFKGMALNLPGMAFQLLRTAAGDLVFPYISDGAHAVCGAPPETIQHDSSAFLDRIIPEDREAFMEAMYDSAHHLSPWNWEGRIDASGIKWVNWRASPRRLENGDILWDGILFNITDSKVAELAIRQSSELLRALSSHLQTVREEEKAKIAREVHDELGSSLTALKMDIFWLSDKLLPEQELLQKKINGMGQLVDVAVQTTRRIVTELRPTILDNLGLTAAVEWQAGEFQKHTGIQCEVEANLDEDMLDEQRSLALFRIFQEAFTNILRHANATAVAVSLQTNNGQIIMSIRDNGSGMGEEHVQDLTAHGILGMFERARGVGGDVRVDSKPGKGTTIVVTVPGCADAS